MDKDLREIGLLEREYDADGRWHRLSAGTLSVEDDVALRAMAETSEEARLNYEMFRPLGLGFRDRMVAKWRSCTDLVQRALDGDIEAQRQLVKKLMPVIQYKVGRMLRLWRSGSASSRNLPQEVEDMVQEVFWELFKDDSKVLRRWSEERGSLEVYVGHIARIRTAAVLRSRRGPWREEPQPTEDLDSKDSQQDPEGGAVSRDELDKVCQCLLAGFTPEDDQLFDLLIIQEVSPKEAAEETGKSIEAVYKWRSRLYEKARECRRKLS